MHILVIPSFYPSAVRPVTGIFFRDQVEALREAGHQVGVLVAPRIRETIDHIRKTRRWDSITHEDGDVYRMHRGWFPRVFPLICAFWHGHEALKAYERYVADHGKPDILHAHNIFYSGYMAVKIKQHYGIPVVLTEHSSNFLRGRIFLPGQHYVVRKTLAGSNVVLAVADALADVLRAYQVRSIELIDNMVDTNYFAYHTPLPAFTFASVGRMVKVKRFDVLLRAFAAAFPNGEAHLRIGGGGPDTVQLQALAQSLGIAEWVEFTGSLSREQVRDLFQQAHVVVSSSDVETFGVTLIEAMSCGKPVIATRSGGPERFITPEVGLLVDSGNIPAFAEAMRTLYREYSRYDQDAIRQYCITRFGRVAIVRRLETIYRQILTYS
jgi:glycosyltransferase involved in cell wall biosynthesis